MHPALHSPIESQRKSLWSGDGMGFLLCPWKVVACYTVLFHLSGASDIFRLEQLFTFLPTTISPNWRPTSANVVGLCKVWGVAPRDFNEMTKKLRCPDRKGWKGHRKLQGHSLPCHHYPNPHSPGAENWWQMRLPHKDPERGPTWANYSVWIESNCYLFIFYFMCFLSVLHFSWKSWNIIPRWLLCLQQGTRPSNNEQAE